MATLHMTEAELARDLHGVLEKVRQGMDIVVEEDSRSAVLIHKPEPGSRTIAECLAIARSIEDGVTLDDGFSQDLEEVIAMHREPWNPPSWD